MRTLQHHTVKKNQRGAVLMIMLVIMVVGIAAVLVNSLTSSTVKTAQHEKTAAALAQAKEALIGIAVTYTDYPGSLPCPDTDDDGESDAGGTTGCPQYIGRLPWKTMGLPDLRDAAGERLWYTLSRNVRRYDSVRPLNSDTSGTLNITGTNTVNSLTAIVFAPGANISGQSRSTTQTALCVTTGTTITASRCASNYLEGSNANLSTEANQVLGVNPNQSYQTANTSDTFNDQLISITQEQLFPAVEMRIAREAKSCLDEYATVSDGKYPWAVPATDTVTYAGTLDSYFGRISAAPDISLPSAGNDSAMQTTWPVDCLFTSVYWPDWRNLVFYQVADGYQPGGSASCVGCLSIAGSGNTAAGSGTYHAAVLVARRAIGGQVRNPTDSTTYLENLNRHQATLATTFETYNSSDPNYSTVNDLVLCLDGNSNCK
ncbi:MAG: hypothetical protein NUV63_02370 [Gallionella sp.]|nr:hypothetical protein [Gallionella sp.]